jgi:tetratricopeptide (TPR) repeat protein/glycosyltransferase involved in cell wall biosynthesis
MPSSTRPRSKYNSLPHGVPTGAQRSATELFGAAVKHHLANDLDAAEKGYRGVIALEPKFAEALNNLGVLIRPRDAKAAHALFERAVAARPRYAEALFNLALSCMVAGKLLEAARGFRSVIDIDANSGRAWNELGSCLRGLGELDAGLEASRRAVALLPNDAATHNNLGNVLLQSGRLDRARAAYEQALAIHSEYPEAINNLGTVYRGMRRPELALPMFLRALELKPGYLDAMHNLSLGLPPGVPGAELIEGRLRAEVARTPDDAAPLAVLAVFLQESGRFAEARELANEVVRRDADNIDGWTVLGICAAEALDLREALRCYDRALAIDPRAGVVRWNRAIALLALGDYEEGWQEYESRWNLVHMALDRRLVDRKEWNGGSLDGKTILVYTEQGLGDAIQFARFGAELKKKWKTARIVVECDPSLVSLFATCDWVEAAIARGVERPEFDEHVALLSLPRILGAPLDALPTEPAFPPVRRPIASRIRKRDGELHVGIVWGGRSPNPALARRSLPLDLLAPIARIPNVRLHSLQVGDTSGQLERSSFRARINDLAPDIKDFVDTAAAMRELDLVLTIDTSVAHLAGALGVPVWVMLIRNADWRWLLDRTDSPWYPSARLFRQKTAGDWESVANDVAAALRELASAHSENQNGARPGDDNVNVPMAELASLQRDAAGAPRFTLSVPLPMLANPETFASYALELTGDGVDAEARNFFDQELRSTDAVFDYSAGLGLTALGAATAPNAPALVVAIADSEQEARVVRDAARGAGRDSSVFAHARTESIDLGVDALLERHALEAARVIVRVQRPGEVPTLLPTAAESLMQGRVAAIVWNLRGPTGSGIDWTDQLTLDGLSSLGFEHFELVEDEQGPLLNALNGAPASRTVFSLIVARFEAGPQPVADANHVPVIGMDWQVGATSGWGVYGQNLTRRLLSTGMALPAPMIAPDFDGMSAATTETLAPIVATHLEFAAALGEKNGRMLHVPFTMLRALGNGLHISPSSAAVNAPRNVGVVFFESTDLDRGAIERAKRFDRIIAGSTWNAEVLRAHGLDNVVTVLQGIDATAFKARPRKARRHDRFVVFSGGKLEYRKGQDIVVAAFREFVRRHPEAKLMIAWHNHWPQTMNEVSTAGHVRGVPTVVGGRADMTRWLEQNGIPAASVIDLGLRGNAEMASLIADADVALFTNRAEGGTNLVAMECLAAGVPTILSANTGHLDLIDDSRCFALRRQGASRPTPSFRGVDGWGESSVDEAVAALERVHGDPDEASRRASNAAVWMRGLSWDAQIDKLYDAIGDLV